MRKLASPPHAILLPAGILVVCDCLLVGGLLLSAAAVVFVAASVLRVAVACIC